MEFTRTRCAEARRFVDFDPILPPRLVPVSQSWIIARIREVTQVGEVKSVPRFNKVSGV